MAVVRVVALVLCAGCLGSLGLEQTEPGSDRDRDGVYDVIDNCPETTNPDQLDGDRDGIGNACECLTDAVFTDADLDGIGDACDRCPGGNDTYDEDGDGLADLCDPCPSYDGAVLSPATDLDGDRLIDGECDPSASQDERRYFDGFEIEPNYAWHPARNTPRWVSDGGALRSSSISPDETAMELYAIRLPLGAGTWVVETRLVVPLDVELDTYFGVELFDTGFGTLRCELRNTGDGWHLAAVQGLSEATFAIAVVPGSSVTLRATTTEDGLGGNQLACTELATNLGVSTSIGDLLRTRGVRLFANAPADFHYIDIITRRN